MVCQHLRDSQEGTEATTLPESTQEKQPRVQTDGGLLPHHSVKSVLTYCMSAWYSCCTAADKSALQRDINTAQKITACSLPSLESIARSRYLSRANNILKDSSHPGHHLFTLLPSGRRYRSMRAGTTRLNNSFFPSAIRLLNSQS